jgi:hypothetical protein
LSGGDTPLEAGGTWWVPGNRDVEVGGRLTYRNCQPFLTLDGGLPGVGPDYPVIRPFTIHGTSQMRSLTLHRATVESFQAGISGVHTAGLRVERVIVGAHVDPDRQTFRKAAIRLTHLDDWVDENRFDLNFSAPQTITLSHVSPPIQSVDLTEPMKGKVTLSIAGIPPAMGPGIRRAAISQVARLVFELNEGITIDQLWDDLLRPIENLLTACIGARNFVTELDVANLTKATYDPPLSVFEAGIHSGDDQERYHQFWMMVPFSTFTIWRLPTWLEDARQLGGMTALALDSVHGTGYLESRLSEACQSAEGLHRRCFSGSRRIPLDATKDLRGRFKDLTPDEYRDAVRDALSGLGEPTLRTRLEELFSELDGALDDLIPDGSKWANDVKNARNQQAHQLLEEGGGPDVSIEPDYRHLYYLTQSTALCVVTNLLRRCGLDGATLRDGVQRAPSIRGLASYIATIE